MKTLPIIFLFFVSIASAQFVGGESVTQIVDLPSSARAQYLGKAAFTYTDKDVSLAPTNSSLLDVSMKYKVQLGSSFMYGNDMLNIYTVLPIQKKHALGLGIQKMDYGYVPITDVNGIGYGRIRPQEYVFQGQYSFAFHKYKVGIGTKFIYTELVSNPSLACGIDISALRSDSSGSQTYGFIIKNVGGEIIQSKNESKLLPFDIQFGYSKRLAHMPFRFGVVAHHLHTWNITYDDPASATKSGFGNSTTTSTEYSFVDNLFRHLAFSGELYLGKIIRVGMSYDHLKRSELSFEGNKGLAGFSFGLGIVTKRFDFGYAHSKYTTVGSINHFSLVVKVNEFLKKK
jgi:hypothetical protein